ncbi:MAG: aminotransferase class I/II-fold pyridoxal phosphate-dependent enzyme [Armatimonadota bacterium]
MIKTSAVTHKKGEDFYKRQKRTPYFDVLRKYVDDNILTFHCPGHQQGKGAYSEFRNFLGINAFRADVCPVYGMDDLHQPKDVVKEALELAAEAYGSDYSYFLLNGSTSGNQAMIMTVCNPGDKLILSRNAHKSATSALILSGACPVYVLPEFDDEMQVDHTITVESTKKVLEANLDAKALFILSPTYYGATADLKSLTGLAHSYDKIAVVDEAWGPHLHFNDKLPMSAIDAGADICVNSTHKLIGGMSQASMMHLKGTRIDRGKLQAVLRIFLSTSPNSFLVSSLDVARMQMATEGEELLNKAIFVGDYLREKIRDIPGFKVYGRDIIGRPGVYDYDPTRVVFTAKNLGFSGYTVEKLLRNKYNIQVEMADLFNIVVLITLGHSVEDADKLINALADISKKCKENVEKSELFHKKIGKPIKLPDFPALVLTPREAFVSDFKTVNFKESAGMISNEIITPYPPGIPLICPGERITQDIIDYLQIEIEAGVHIQGSVDPGLETIRVVK